MGRGGVGALGLILRIGTLGAGCLALAHCGQAPSGGSRVDSKYGVSASPRVVQLGEPVPKGGGFYRVGKPYTIAGQTYAPEADRNYRAEGIASWYGEDFHGRRTANGEIYDMESITAAHPTMPIPSYARVTNLRNKRSIIVRVNDRGPYHQGRVIDVSVKTAKLLGFYEVGTIPVRVEYVGQASLTGSDDMTLQATLRHGAPAPGPSEIRIAAARAFPSEQSERSPPVAAVARRPSAAPVVTARTPPQATAQVSANPSASTFDSRFAPMANAPVAPSRAEPVSAFAGPPASMQSNSAVITGRGLY
jgi:rare lipoprotein A